MEKSSASGHCSMSQDQAQWLFNEGATLVFLDVPPGTEFGIDYNSWEVGKKFKGVKMIPPGFHFVHYSAVGRDHQVAPRTGFMYYFKQKEILIKSWDKAEEDMKSGLASSEDQERIGANKQELDRYLGAYPYDSYKKWVSLTNYITEDLLNHINPLVGKISAVTPLQSIASTTQSRQEQREASALNETPPKSSHFEDEDFDPRLPDMKPLPGTQMRFSTISRRKFPEGASASEITKYNMDHSYLLKTLLQTPAYGGSPEGILGELQVAFISFLIGQVFDGFEQWKKLVNLLCCCVEAIGEYSELYTNFIGVIHYHVQEIPEDFFVDIVSRDNFLSGTLSKFFENLEVSLAPQELKKRGQRFQAHLEKRFQWTFSSESDEYAPVVVE